MGNRSSFTRALSIVAVLYLTSGCNTPPLYEQGAAATSEGVANVFVSVYPEVPWSDIASLLAPQHNLTIAQAQSMAAQTTQVQISEFLSSFAAGLGLSLPTVGRTLTSTTNASGQTTTTQTVTKAEGTPPPSAGTPAASVSPLPLPGFGASAQPAAPGVDASTLLNTGTAVYQQAQILDSQISKQYLPDGYTGDLITF